MISLYEIEDQVIFGSFKPAQRTPYVRGWVNTRYARLWTSFEWAFKMVEAVAMATVPGSRYLTLPSDFGAMRGLYDETGVRELPCLEEAVFNRNYLSSRIAGQTGKPEAYTVVNRRVILGPVPNAVYTFYGSYKRLLGYDTGNPSGTFKVGQMGETDPTKDKPWWPAEHWEVLVIGARALGLKLVNDTAWFALEQQFEDLVQGMVADDLLHDASNTTSRQYGRDQL